MRISEDNCKVALYQPKEEKVTLTRTLGLTRGFARQLGASQRQKLLRKEECRLNEWPENNEGPRQLARRLQGDRWEDSLYVYICSELCLYGTL